MKAIHLELALTKNETALDQANADAMVHAGWFDTCILSVPSIHQYPEAHNDPMVQQIVETCRTLRIDLVWMRQLWTAWGDRRPDPHCEHSIDFYETTRARMDREQTDLRAAKVGIYVEPYGQADQKWMKNYSFVGVLSAPSQGFDIVAPYGSSRPTHYSWGFASQGWNAMNVKTYYLEDARDNPVMNPPPGVTPRLDIWCSYVGPQGGEPVDNETAISPQQAMDIYSQLGSIKQRYPECIGTSVYPGRKWFAQVVEKFK